MSGGVFEIEDPLVRGEALHKDEPVRFNPVERPTLRKLRGGAVLRCQRAEQSGIARVFPVDAFRPSFYNEAVEFRPVVADDLPVIDQERDFRRGGHVVGMLIVKAAPEQDGAVRFHMEKDEGDVRCAIFGVHGGKGPARFVGGERDGVGEDSRLLFGEVGSWRGHAAIVAGRDVLCREDADADAEQPCCRQSRQDRIAGSLNMAVDTAGAR